MAAVREADPPSAWIAMPIVGFVLLFLAFGFVIWRSVDPERWAEACPSCRRKGSDRRDCPNRPPGDGESVAVGLVAVLNELFGPDD